MNALARELLALGALTLAAAPLGVFLVQRRLSLIGDAMSHGILPGAAVGYMVAGLSAPAMAAGGLVAGLAVAFLGSLIARRTSLGEDASLAAIYMTALAAGVILMLRNGSTGDLVHVLFGDGVTIPADRTALIHLASAATLCAFPLLYRAILMDALDARLLRGTLAGFMAHYGFLALVVVNLIAAFLAVGSLLGVALMVFPAICARLWTPTIGRMVWVAPMIGLAGAAVGLSASHMLAWPPGPAVVLALGFLYLLSLLLGSADGLLGRWRTRHEPHLEG